MKQNNQIMDELEQSIDDLENYLQKKAASVSTVQTKLDLALKKQALKDANLRKAEQKLKHHLTSSQLNSGLLAFEDIELS